MHIPYILLFLSFMTINIKYQSRQMYTHTPVGDLERRRWCEHVADGGFGCDPHATELVIVLLIPCSSLPVFGPAAVPGAQGLVALLQVHSVQVSI